MSVPATVQLDNNIVQLDSNTVQLDKNTVQLDYNTVQQLPCFWAGKVSALKSSKTNEMQQGKLASEHVVGQHHGIGGPSQ